MPSKKNIVDLWDVMSQKANVESKEEITEDDENQPPPVNEEDVQYHIIVLGDSGGGKSSFIQTILGNSSSALKPTIALEYSFAKKSLSRSKLIMHLWEIGGEAKGPELLSIPPSTGNQMVVVVVDMSRVSES